MSDEQQNRLFPFPNISKPDRPAFIILDLDLVRSEHLLFRKQLLLGICA